MLLLLAVSLYAYATEKVELGNMLEQLKVKFTVVKNGNYPDGMSLPTGEDFTQINEKLGCPIPPSLVEFYLQVGNLNFSKLSKIGRAHGGNESTLYRLIRDGQDRGIPGTYLTFCQVEGSEYFSYERKNGKVTRFRMSPDLEQHDTYSDLASWIKAMWF